MRNEYLSMESFKKILTKMAMTSEVFFLDKSTSFQQIEQNSKNFMKFQNQTFFIKQFNLSNELNIKVYIKIVLLIINSFICF